MSITIPLAVICGPTAIGKTEAGLILAQRWNSEIISADSRQIYKYMDIGTAKPGARERNLVKHHFIDSIEPDQSYNAGQFQKESFPVIESLRMQGKIPIIIGGSGLYIRAAVYGLFSCPAGNATVKADLQKAIEDEGVQTLFHKLTIIDPQTAERLHPNDKQRITRALEVYYTTGETISSLQEKHTAKEPLRPTIIFLLHRPRKELYGRIEQRIDTMIKLGFVDEVRNLLNRGYKKDDPGMQSLGYKILAEYCEGSFSLSAAVSRLKRDTRHYAKRQITWFRKERNVTIIEITQDMTSRQLADILGEIMTRFLESNNRCMS
ncbi:MAG: tRNA (adenosine(37)-N6)-dimethylallyltransferase MiaA [bacterium]